MSLEQDVVLLRQQNAQLLAANAHLQAQLQEVLGLVGQLRQTIEWLAMERQGALPKSPIGEALTSATNQWPTLIRYPNDASFFIDNNAAERSIRPLAMGRKNWLFIGGDGGLTASVLVSLWASVKRHGLNPWAYFTDVLTRLATKPSDLTHLLPDIWTKLY